MKSFIYPEINTNLVSMANVQKTLGISGFYISHRYPDSKSLKKPLLKDFTNDIIRRYTVDGFNTREIGEQYGVTKEPIRKLLAKNNIPRKRRNRFNSKKYRKEYIKEWYRKNPEKRKIYYKQYKERHSERIRKRSRLWARKHRNEISEKKGLIKRKQILRITPSVECMLCGYKKYISSLEIHHRDNNHLNNSISNLIVLCRNCHQAIHSTLRGLTKKDQLKLKKIENKLDEKIKKAEEGTVYTSQFKPKATTETNKLRQDKIRADSEHVFHSMSGQVI